MTTIADYTQSTQSFSSGSSYWSTGSGGVITQSTNVWSVFFEGPGASNLALTAITPGNPIPNNTTLNTGSTWNVTYNDGFSSTTGVSLDGNYIYMVVGFGSDSPSLHSPILLVYNISSPSVWQHPIISTTINIYYPFGKIVTDNNNYVYFADCANFFSGAMLSTIYRLGLPDPSGAGGITSRDPIKSFPTSTQQNDITDVEIYTNGSGTQFLLFPYRQSGSSEWWIGYVDLSNSSNFTGVNFTPIPLPGGWSYIPNLIRGITYDATSTSLYILTDFPNIIQYTLSGTTPTFSGTSHSLTLTTPGTPAISGSYFSHICCNRVGGSPVGNLRFFLTYTNMAGLSLSTGNYFNFVKVYPPGASQYGGDPHISTFDGKSFIISGEEPFVVLDTLDKNRVMVWCDSFTIKDHKNLVSELQYQQVDVNESYIKTLNIETKDRKIKIDMTNLEILSDESRGDDINQISISNKIECDSLSVEEYPSIKNKKYLKDLICVRNIEIKYHNIKFEIIRTKCINYSDVYTELDLDAVKTYRGALVDGEILSPETIFEK